MSMAANYPPAPNKMVDFDQQVAPYTIDGGNFKSHNGDNTFDANAIYFKYTKAYKVKVVFFPDPGENFYGVVDIYRYTMITARTANFDVRPTRIAGTNPVAFEFYANPYYLDLQVGFFEPRVYKGSFHLARIEVTKELEFQHGDYTRYALFLARRARDMLESARQGLFSGDYGLCMHFSRLSIELSLKMIFPAFKEESFQWVHDLSKRGVIPPKLRKQLHRETTDFPLERLLWLSQQHIRSDRTDFYGDPESLYPADMVVEHPEALAAQEDASFTHEKCMQLVEMKLKR